MELQIENILNKIENHEYPDNGGSGEFLDTWGVGFNLTDNIDTSIFDIYRLLEKTIKKAKKQVSELSSKTQLILDYKKGDWIIKFELDTEDCELDDRYSMIAVIDKNRARTLLTRVVNAGIQLRDVMSKIEIKQ